MGICALRLAKNVSGATMSASFLLRASVAKATSIFGFVEIR